ncbi:cation:proton antiporter subunit C [Bowmanella dokdonensis]|uniref:Cation:proton antiporter subunit C n=1 Tax=Bowmanella dokdonensis TaxID=751969 RepID=A0A939DNH4_9ALTE|nr:cation:proton antiporter subunit C [Bowmanella dokdonensis]MBN7825011.1 cation:proton antiporter subunit C [Bowmanella dokdonensis]
MSLLSIDHLYYWVIVILLMLGMYSMIAKPNLLKKLAGLSIFQSAIFLFYISLGKQTGGTAPIIAPGYDTYANPLPHVLMLTAIVVGVATVALGYALIIRIRDAYDSMEEDQIREQDDQA